MISLKKNKSIAIGVILLLILGIGTYNYVFQETEQIENSRTAFEGTSNEFITKIGTNVAEWTNKVVSITGSISTVNEEGVILDGTVFCQFSENQKLNTLKENQTITLKGMVIGYDDLLNELKLNQCILKK